MDDEFRSTKYTIDKLIGSGAFSVVWQGTERKTGKLVAIKKVTSVFRSLDDAKHTLREIKLLRHLNHENVWILASGAGLIISKVIKLLDIVKPPEGKDGFEDLYLVFELMFTDLTKLLATSSLLELDHIKLFTYQIMRGLKYVHSAGVIHRDLIADFGSGRGEHGARLLKMTQMEMTTTRWYRAPEGLLHAKHYTSAVDVWSVGCILAELLLRRPLFAGDGNSEMLSQIFSFLGTDCVDLAQVESEKYRELLKNLDTPARRPVATTFPELANTNSEALDLLNKMLVYPPEKRIAVAEALSHPFFGILHDEEDEPIAISSVSNDWEATSTLDEFRDRLWQEVLAFDGDKLR